MMLDEEEDEQNIGGVAECLILESRRIVRQGVMVHVDDEDAISLEISFPVSLKAHGLLTHYWVDDGGIYSVKHGHGRMGFVRRERIAASPGETARKHFAVVPVTAKHNLRRMYDPKTKKWADAKYSAVFLRTRHPAEEKILRFGPGMMNWEPKKVDTVTLRDDYTWEYGIDIDCGFKISDRKNGITDEPASFELVRPDFQLKKGQKVGIVVYFDEASAPTNKTASPDPIVTLNLTPKQIEDIYGKPLQPNIYTGQITKAEEGQQHIEYDINSFTGCRAPSFSYSTSKRLAVA